MIYHWETRSQSLMPFSSLRRSKSRSQKTLWCLTCSGLQDSQQGYYKDSIVIWYWERFLKPRTHQNSERASVYQNFDEIHDRCHKSYNAKT